MKGTVWNSLQFTHSRCNAQTILNCASSNCSHEDPIEAPENVNKLFAFWREGLLEMRAFYQRGKRCFRRINAKKKKKPTHWNFSFPTDRKNVKLCKGLSSNRGNRSRLYLLLLRLEDAGGGKRWGSALLDTLASGEAEAHVCPSTQWFHYRWTPGAGKRIVEVGRQAESRAGRGGGAGEESEMAWRGSPRREWGGWSELDGKQAGNVLCYKSRTNTGQIQASWHSLRVTQGTVELSLRLLAIVAPACSEGEEKGS